MVDIADYLRAWTAEVNEVSLSSVLDLMDFGIIEQLEDLVTTNPTAAQLVQELGEATDRIAALDDFTNLMAAYDVYAEGKVGLRMIQAGLAPERLPAPGPDFRFAHNGREFFVALSNN